MIEPARAPKPDHPLVADRARLEAITDNMYAQIHRTIFKMGPDRRSERVLHGGESADDILQNALIALLKYDPNMLQTTWEALSVGIAKKKALEALRRATRGRGAGGTGVDQPDDVSVVALDGAFTDPPDDNTDHDPEVVFERNQQQLVLLRLARERLNDRERAVFYGIHFNGVTRAALAGEIGISPQAVGQMYAKVLRVLHAAACKDPSFPTIAMVSEGEKNE